MRCEDLAPHVRPPQALVAIAAIAVTVYVLYHSVYTTRTNRRARLGSTAVKCMMAELRDYEIRLLNHQVTANLRKYAN